MFSTHYNFAFHKPKKDECDLCNKYKSGGNVSQKEFEMHQKNKNEIREQKEADKNAAVAKKLHACCFDIEQVLHVLHCTVGQLYYTLIHENSTYTTALYIVSVTKMGHAFVWSEVEAKRGSCEVVTCMFKDLKSLPKSIKHVILFSDTCGGQNRNKNFVSMLKYVVNDEHFQVIEHKFMEKGHSQMEVDSIHAAIETRKKTSTISIPTEYIFVDAHGKNPQSLSSYSTGK